MNIQEIFDRVIARGYYNVLTDNSAMCNSLHVAWCWDDINNDEYLFARKQIKEYLLPTDCAYLEEALEKDGLPSTIEARTAIYRDWANRPPLKSKEQANADVQAIFDKVIASGRYAEGITTFMCTALTLCLNHKILPHEEVMLAKNEIDHYLGGYHTLGLALVENGLPCKPKDRLEIYKDWENRPKLLKEFLDE